MMSRKKRRPVLEGVVIALEPARARMLEYCSTTTLRSLLCCSRWTSREPFVQVLRLRWCGSLVTHERSARFAREFAESGDAEVFAARLAETLREMAPEGKSLLFNAEAARVAHGLVVAMESCADLERAVEAHCDPTVATLLAIAWWIETLPRAEASAARSWLSCKALVRCLRLSPKALDPLGRLLEDCALSALADSLFPRQSRLAFAVFAASGALSSALDLAASRPPDRAAAAARLFAAARHAAAPSHTLDRLVDEYDSPESGGPIEAASAARRLGLDRADLPSIAGLAFEGLVRRLETEDLDPRHPLPAIFHFANSALAFPDLDAFFRHLRSHPDAYLDTQRRHLAAIRKLFPRKPAPRDDAAAAAAAA